eukprot:CAMPEP_0184715280 /NCGR_PEP_ID=MMETSP0314-20130426/5240_1 /TAXON_ID=38298 /ORGANISM="Rhodella maculata, Strain CCMP 736" /LENGTH=153 /DNA_ID=CAMNT_0027178373 /DNA_START=191 /DNA_END=652 /DNA_ORIENTATION=-
MGLESWVETTGTESEVIFELGSPREGAAAHVDGILRLPRWVEEVERKGKVRRSLEAALCFDVDEEAGDIATLDVEVARALVHPALPFASAYAGVVGRGVGGGKGDFREGRLHHGAGKGFCVDFLADEDVLEPASAVGRLSKPAVDVRKGNGEG